MVDVDNKRFTLPRYDPDERSVTPHCAKHPARMAVWAHEQVTSPDVLNPFQRAVGHEDLLTRDVTTRGRFHQEGAALFQCFRHRPGHLNLRRPRLKPGHRTADRAARGQQRGRAIRKPHRITPHATGGLDALDAYASIALTLPMSPRLPRRASCWA